MKAKVCSCKWIEKSEGDIKKKYFLVTDKTSKEDAQNKTELNDNERIMRF